MAGELDYEVSMRCAERALLPAVRAAAIVADGFSRREQLPQATGRTPLQTAELLADGLADRTRP